MGDTAGNLRHEYCDGKDPWIIRDTAFIKMILDGKIAALQGIVTGTRYE